jgi:hypothetical protein
MEAAKVCMCYQAMHWGYLTINAICKILGKNVVPKVCVPCEHKRSQTYIKLGFVHNSPIVKEYMNFHSNTDSESKDMYSVLDSSVSKAQRQIILILTMKNTKF